MLLAFSAFRVYIWFFTVILEAAASVALADLLELRAAPELLVRLIIFGLPLASELRNVESTKPQIAILSLERFVCS